MARIRKFCAYRNTDGRPYTRVSKFKKKSYIRMSPNPKVVKFVVGNSKKSFPYQVKLNSRTFLNIRDNALESARQSSNRVLEGELGASGYRLNVSVYPHHILRENPVASGAGADRFSTGMKKAFGKPYGVAARVKEGQTIFSVEVEKKDVDLARKAMNRAATKLPCSCMIEVSQNS